MDANSHEAGGIFDCACTAAPTLLKPERSTNDIKPHRTRIFKLSCDEQFEAKFWDVIGVYLDPPDNAVVLCCDEKSQCQALQRSQPGLPLGQGHFRTVTHDYYRRSQGGSAVLMTFLFEWRKNRGFRGWLRSAPYFVLSARKRIRAGLAQAGETVDFMPWGVWRSQKPGYFSSGQWISAQQFSCPCIEISRGRRPGVLGGSGLLFAPADVRKEGPSFDLPIALGMLKLEENNRLPALDAFCITGELALSGQLRPVKGVSRSAWKRSVGADKL